MTYQEKKVWAMIASGTLITFLYIRNALSAYKTLGPDLLTDGPYWAKTMLVYIGIGIVGVIVFMIIFHIFLAISLEVGNRVKEAAGQDHEDTEDYFDQSDEMDHLIGLKAEQAGYSIVGIGFTCGLVTMALNMPIGIMMNITFLSFMLANLFEGAVRLYFYKRGVYHG